MPDFSAVNLTVYRGDRRIFDAVSFTVREGECLQVTGPNGAGKTTLIRSLCGFVEADSLEMTYGGRLVTARDPDFQWARAYLGHEPPLKADLSARENLRFGVGLRRRLQAADLDRALERVGARDFGSRAVRTLSAGQRRRVALAALWLSGASLWLLDEPTTHLDGRGQSLVASLIEEHLSAGGCVIAATHQALGVGETHLRSLLLGARA